MLHGGLVRARVPAGRIRRIDVSAAEAIPGVVCITAADFPTSRFGIFVADEVSLVADRIRYAGEPIVALAAPDLSTLHAAKEAVVIDVERLDGVFDAEQALDEGSALVHTDWASYREVGVLDRDRNCCGSSVIETGDVDAAFAQAALVVEGRYSTPRVHQGYIEPRACLAVATADGGFHVRTSTQNPFRIRQSLSDILAVPISRVRVEGVTIGGGFGGELDTSLEHFACALARNRSAR